MRYIVTYEFLADQREWVQDTLTNNGEGFTIEDARSVAEQLCKNTVCRTRNVTVSPMQASVSLTVGGLLQIVDLDVTPIEWIDRYGSLSLGMNLVQDEWPVDRMWTTEDGYLHVRVDGDFNTVRS